MAEDLESIEARARELVKSHRELMRDLVKFRDRHGLSQDEVAERMGVSQPTVSSFERYDANPTLSTIRRYALAVGATIDYRINDDCQAHSDATFESVVAGWLMADSGFSYTRPDSNPKRYSSKQSFENRTALTYVDAEES